MRKSSQIIISILFVLAITVPSLMMLFGKEQIVSTVEKRKLAPRPTLVLNYDGLTALPAACQAYVNDHFGLRSQLIQLYNSLFIAVFGSSPKPGVIVGKGNWLFMAAEHVLEDFLGRTRISPNMLREWKSILFERQEWLTDQGITYLFLIPPNKMNVYPEFLPERISARSGKTSLDQFVEYLNKTPQFKSFLDLRPPLMAAKQQGQLYLSGDTHWNFEGSYIAYRAIMERLAQRYPELKPLPRKQMVREDRILEGDLALTLNLGELYKEKTWILWPPDHENLIKFQPFKGYPQPATEQQSFRTGHLYYNENDEKRLKAIFISDSFGSALRGYLTAHFKRIVFVRDARFEDMTPLIEKEHPDIVIDLNVARGMDVALGQNLEIHNYIRHKHKNETKTILAVTGQELKEVLSETVQIKPGSASDDGFRFKATGKDPQLYLHILPEISDAPLLLTFRLHSPDDTTFRLFFRGQEDENYSGKKMVEKRLRRGENSLSIKIYEAVDLSSIRIDPGEKPGDYMLESLSVELDKGGF